jgi:hypothetical protein
MEQTPRRHPARPDRRLGAPGLRETAMHGAPGLHESPLPTHHALQMTATIRPTLPRGLAP